MIFHPNLEYDVPSNQGMDDYQNLEYGLSSESRV